MGSGGNGVAGGSWGTSVFSENNTILKAVVDFQNIRKIFVLFLF